MTTTVKDSFHLLLPATWCVYTLPKTFSLAAVASSYVQNVTLTAALDKPASFGQTCASSRAVNLQITAEDRYWLEGFWAEVVR